MFTSYECEFAHVCVSSSLMYSSGSAVVSQEDVGDTLGRGVCDTTSDQNFRKFVFMNNTVMLYIIGKIISCGM